jgi:hypothetical protein
MCARRQADRGGLLRAWSRARARDSSAGAATKGSPPRARARRSRVYAAVLIGGERAFGCDAEVETPAWRIAAGRSSRASAWLPAAKLRARDHGRPLRKAQRPRCAHRAPAQDRCWSARSNSALNLSARRRRRLERSRAGRDRATGTCSGSIILLVECSHCGFLACGWLMPAWRSRGSAIPDRVGLYCGTLS